MTTVFSSMQHVFNSKLHGDKFDSEEEIEQYISWRRSITLLDQAGRNKVLK